MRIAIVGNSGSGKSTLARELAEVHSLASLDLDSIVWEQGKIAVLRKHGCRPSRPRCLLRGARALGD
jgi:adenylate kinase family enzyme